LGVGKSHQGRRQPRSTGNRVPPQLHGSLHHAHALLRVPEVRVHLTEHPEELGAHRRLIRQLGVHALGASLQEGAGGDRVSGLLPRVAAPEELHQERGHLPGRFGLLSRHRGGGLGAVPLLDHGTPLHGQSYG
jgi:hypothetical protein